MGGHDSIKELSDILGDKELVKKISPKFDELSLDIQEISKHSKNPLFLATLLFKLAEEREKTNKLLEQVFDKFDAIMLQLKTQQTPLAQAAGQSSGRGKNPLNENSMLPEQDQMIMHLAKKQGQVSAEDVRSELGYRGKNAASQRLSRLSRDGHLRKVQAGRKVFYLAKQT